MNYHLKRVPAVPPVAEPLLLSDVKLHVRAPDVSDAAQDAYLTNLIKAARRWCEDFTSRCFIEQTWDLLLPNGFPSSQPFMLSSNEIRIPRVPLKTTSGITHVKYLDSNGAQQTLAAGTDYVVQSRGEPAIVLPTYGKSWPATRAWADANGNYPVELRFIAGYGTAGTSVPETFRQAMLLLIGHWYENREEASEVALAQVPMAAEALLWMERFHPW